MNLPIKIKLELEVSVGNTSVVGTDITLTVKGMSGALTKHMESGKDTEEDISRFITNLITPSETPTRDPIENIIVNTRELIKGINTLKNRFK